MTSKPSPSHSSVRYEGWLLIAKMRKHLFKPLSFRQYYCVLEGHELRYYENEDRSISRDGIDIWQYNHVIASPPSHRHPLIQPFTHKTKQRQERQRTFRLVSEHVDGLVCIADSQQAMEEWVRCIEQELARSKQADDVLEKWLERFEISKQRDASLEIVPSSPSIPTASSVSSSSSTIDQAQQQQQLQPPNKSLSTLTQTIAARRKSSTHTLGTSPPSEPIIPPSLALRPIITTNKHRQINSS